MHCAERYDAAKVAKATEKEAKVRSILVSFSRLIVVLRRRPITRRARRRAQPSASAANLRPTLKSVLLFLLRRRFVFKLLSQILRVDPGTGYSSTGKIYVTFDDLYGYTPVPFLFLFLYHFLSLSRC